MKQICLITIAMFFVAACNNTTDNTASVKDSNTTVNAPSVPVEGSTARTALDVVGTYKGVLPCADCGGMETVIELGKDSNYTRSTRYLGKPKDDQVYSASGKWQWADDSTIQLGSIKEGPNLYFAAEGKLIQLDMAGKKISGKLAAQYILRKQ